MSSLSVLGDNGYAFLTVSELAQILRVSPATVRANAKAGLVPGAVKHGTRWRFRSAEIAAWLDAQT